MSSMDVTFCASNDYKDPNAEKRATKAASITAGILDPFTFPAWKYTTTDKSGKVVQFETRARWINGKYWGDADIAYYEALEATKQRFAVESLVEEVEQGVAVAE